MHFPWCAKKCPYCDFNSHPVSGEIPEREYVAALKQDLLNSLAANPAPLRSIFCGGGTPSLFSAEAFGELLQQLQPWITEDSEITMEANPGTTEHRDLRDYRHAGINRISFGAQSFNPPHLLALGRIHSADDIDSSFQKARRAGFDNINLDVMYGLPGQTTAEALRDLEHALSLEPDHLSWYQLTIEPKTEFARRPPILASESSIAETERQGRALLASHGFERYEVSAYARNGLRCWHNENYWRFGDYLGVGAGAHGKLRRGNQIIRTRKALQPRRYLAEPTATIEEEVAQYELVFEFMLNALRLREGVSFDTFSHATGLPIEGLEPVWSQLAAAELVEPKRIAASDFGYEHLDSIIQKFLP
jgi:oxygen-independent coproporphyrinogen-3 oxidase